MKLIRRGLDTEDVLRRFRTERQVLADLEHPNIARLIDGGATEDGHPYLVVEYVDGIPIDRYCAENDLSLRDRLGLFRTICPAVNYAHRNLVVHRDLKPSNILVTAEGEVKLLDFGVAKVLDPEAVETGEATVASTLIMTPRYASPEQVLGERMTTATDVYSLGVLLYELLTGCAPFQVDRTPLAELRRIVCEQEPTRPSEFIRLSDTKPREETRRLARSLAGDLDNIVLKALRKEPERRYASAEQFSEDIQRYLDGHPVHARPDTFGYRAGKFARRNAVAVTVGAAPVVSLIAGAVISATLYFQARRATAEARAQYASAEALSRSAVAIHQATLVPEDPDLAESRDLLGRVLVERGSLSEAVELLREAVDSRRKNLGASDRDTVRSELALGDCLTRMGEFEHAEPFLLSAWTTLGSSTDAEPDALRAAALCEDLYLAWERPEEAARFRPAGDGR